MDDSTIIYQYYFDDTRIVDSLQTLNEQVETLTVQVTDLQARLDESVSLTGELEGFALFGATVLLCFFAYKFFRMFF